ncbi:MAG TPA: helix-turn-helix domain-containing protein [Promicromonospora sp.]|nr:helix-turn-helix domain-containing protein [Promicromonospora sp.]
MAGQRSRMDGESRREALLDVGAALFAQRSYDEVEIGDIAAATGVSRGLLYHYFRDKADYFLAVMARRLDVLADASRVAPGGSRLATLRSGLDAYLDFIAANPQWYRSIYRSAISADAAVHDLLEDAHARQAEQILALFPELERSPLRTVAVRGWVLLLARAGMSWLDGADVDREALRDRCLDVLAAALGVPTLEDEG